MEEEREGVGGVLALCLLMLSTNNDIRFTLRDIQMQTDHM